MRCYNSWEFREGAVGGTVSVIAIDGPVAAGKTTVGREVARRLGYIYLDTGVMYRAVGWLSRERQVSLEDDAGLGRLAREVPIRVEIGEGNMVTVGDCQLGAELEEQDVARRASLVATVPEVRRALVAQQRVLAAEGDIVMVGRDIGTVVLPGADLKIFVTGSVRERARRRWRDLLREDREVDFEQVLQDTRARDYRDSTRADSPLVAADDAVTVDTDGMTVEQVVEQIISRLGIGGGP